MKQRPPFAAVVAAILSLAAATAAAAVPTGDEVLTMVDEAISRAVDQIFRYEVRTQEPGKKERVLMFDVYLKGDHRRIDFISPGDIKGMRVLSRSETQQYVYLPAFRKVRRVASHVKAQGFMGTTISHDEMSLVTYGPLYTAKIIAETDKHWTLEAARRADADIPYRIIGLEVRKDIKLPAEIRYHNEEGLHVKTEQRRDYSCKGKLCTPALFEITDHTRNDIVSKMIRRKWQANAGLSDDLFTVRAIQRGR